MIKEVKQLIKKLVFLVFLSSILLLTSCSFGGGRTLVTNEDKSADERMEQILAALKNKDKKALKSLFSKVAMDAANDLNGGIDYLFDFFQGDVKSCEQDTWGSDESIHFGKKSVMLKAWYTVNTVKNKYKFFTIDYIKDTINPNNAGLYTLRVIKAEDEGTQFTYWQDMNIAGIYRPDAEKNKTK